MTEQNSLPGRLHNKVVVIVGGTSGLGSSAVAACVRDSARVITIGRDAAKCSAINQSFGPQVFAFAADAREEQAAERAVQEAVNRFGKLDGLYHVAGGSGRSLGDGPVHEISRQGWEETVQWNLTSLFYSNRAAVRQFLQQNSGGVILNMASVLAAHPAPAFFATHGYAAAKAAIVGLTQASAAYYAPQSIRVNCLMPALIETPMSQRASQDQVIRQFIARKQPLDGGRIGQPSDLDSAVVYFLSDESKFVTGQALAIDGGWSVSDAAATLPSAGSVSKSDNK